MSVRHDCDGAQLCPGGGSGHEIFYPRCARVGRIALWHVAVVRLNRIAFARGCLGNIRKPERGQPSADACYRNGRGRTAVQARGSALSYVGAGCV